MPGWSQFELFTYITYEAKAHQSIASGGRPSLPIPHSSAAARLSQLVRTRLLHSTNLLHGPSKANNHGSSFPIKSLVSNTKGLLAKADFRSDVTIYASFCVRLLSFDVLLVRGSGHAYVPPPRSAPECLPTYARNARNAPSPDRAHIPALSDSIRWKKLRAIEKKGCWFITMSNSPQKPPCRATYMIFRSPF